MVGPGIYWPVAADPRPPQEAELDHETAAGQLAELAAGRLSAERARELEAHAATCADCRGALATATALWAEAKADGTAPFLAPHPDADDLARYALSPGELTTPALAAIGEHARACPTCEREVAMARAARSSAWRRAPAAWLARPGGPMGQAWMRPAFAALALLLTYPSYLGLVELPRERERAARELTAARSHRPAPVAPATSWGGAARTLVLSGPERGPATTPHVRLEPGQPYLPVLLATDPGVLPHAGTVEVTLARPDGSIAWRASATMAALWDERAHAASLLIPAAALATGDYELVVRSPQARSERFRQRIHVDTGR